MAKLQGRRVYTFRGEQEDGLAGAGKMDKADLVHSHGVVAFKGGCPSTGFAVVIAPSAKTGIPRQ